MRRLALLLALSPFAFGACRATTAPAAAPVADARPPGRYGAPVPAGPALPIASVLAGPEAQAGKTVLVEGKVRAACTRRGCWMEIAPSLDKSAPACRVSFKDYGFFVPTDSQGASARVEGVVNVKTYTPEQIAHYESEGGSFPNKRPDGTAQTVAIVANGVELTK
jgi:hypothetical protein